MIDKTCGCGFHGECYIHCNHEDGLCPGKAYKAVGSHGSVKVTDERNGSQQASPDLLGTERERILDLVEAGLKKKSRVSGSAAVIYSSQEFLDIAIGSFNEAVDYALEVIERLRDVAP